MPLAGLTFVVTGKVVGLTRSGAAQAVAAAGGKAAAGMSGSTTAVVVGENPGQNKLAAAAELDVPVIDAADFFGEDGAVVWRPAAAD